MPRSEIPSVALSIAPRENSVAHLAKSLRTGTPAVVGMIVGDKLQLDLRTVFEHQDHALAEALSLAMQG